MLPFQQLDMKEQIKAYFMMLLIPKVNFLSHSCHTKIIKECKKYFHAECAIFLKDKQVQGTYLHQTNESYFHR